MARKRTTVFVEAEDLAIIKTAAARRGVAEAELLREAIHLQAMANRTWTEPFFTHTYSTDQASAQPRVGDVLEDAWAEQSEAYERTKGPAR